MVGSTAQIYVGDVQAANGNATATNPLLLMEQLPILPPPTTVNNTTPGTTTWTAPSGVTSISLSMTGGGGGGGGVNGGAGGLVSGTLAVTPGVTYTLVVAGGGGSSSVRTGGIGGGGSGGSGGGAGGGGGSYFSNGATLLAAAGGGGGAQAGYSSVPGAGGGLTGGSGQYSGSGGTQSAGGAGGDGQQSGSYQQGGNGTAQFGGGGGGYYGGGSGNSGSGGSSFVANLTGTVVNTQGGAANGGGTAPANGGNGYITISYTQTSYRPGNILEIRNYQLNKLIIDPLLNMGVNVSSITSGFQFDVGGAARATSLSTQNIQLSSINGLTFGGPINSTVIGLGSAGYLSTASLVSTVQGLGTAGYISTASLVSTVSGSGSLFASTVRGLGSAGYISTASLVSTFAASGSLFASTVTGLGSAGYISSAVSQSNVVSSINNLLIPYSTLNTNTYFQVKASSTQLYYGAVGSTAQIYVGDVQAANGNTTATNPLLLMEQLPIIIPPVTSNYSYTGSDQTFTVPTGVTALNVILNGAAGGAAYFGATGGSGGYVSGTLAVTPGQSLTIMVGKGGAQGNGSASSNSYGGGGAGGSFSGVGGGRSAIISGGVDRVTAGGGGGAGNGTNDGGAGGGTTGATGGGGANGGGGGTQSSGGVSPVNNSVPWNGSLGQGGSFANPHGGFGGGGGGYYGGGVGFNQGGGGGGSSYVANLTGTVVNTQGGGAAAVFYGAGGNGSITITYSIDPSYRPGNILEIRNYQLNRIVIDPLLNMGIRTSSPQATLDVAGTGRFQTLSTLAFNTSSINGQTFGAPIQSTVRGLGSSGYISTSQLVSTVQSLGAGGWVGTATSDLDMNGYNITSVNGLGIETTVGSIYLFAFPTLPYPLDVPSTGVFLAGNDVFGIGLNSLFLGGTNYEDSISMSTGIVLNTSNSLDITAASNINLYTPTVNRELATLTKIPQPVIQNGYYSDSSNASGSNTITLPYTYNNVDYKVFIQGAINSNDIPGGYTPVFYAEVLTGNTFNVHWAAGSPVYSNPYYWHTQGEYTK
jgi:hypothetical protein